MGDVIRKCVSIINKIAYRRRTLKSKSLVAKHGLWVVISLVALGIIIGSTSTFCYFKVSKIWTDFNKGGHIVVKTSPTPKALASAPSDVSGEVKTSPTAEETLADKIFVLESSKGKNDSCHVYGRHNDYGFGVWGDNMSCYETTEEARADVIKWLEKETGTDAQKLCKYNTGKATTDCPYYQKSLNI